MNIFVTDADPVKAAIYLDDKRIKHMPKEALEMLGCYIHYITGNWIIPFPLWGGAERNTEEIKKQLYNHPCTLWVKRDKANAWWLYLHLCALIIEHEFRFGTQLPVAHFVNQVVPYLSPIDRMPSSFRNSSLFKDKDVVTAYRETMLVKWFQTDKVKPIIWTKRGAPKWAEQQAKLSL